MTKPPKRPRDLNEWAKRMVDLATGATKESDAPSEASEPSRRGGLKGGPARAKKLSSHQRKAIARKAAKSRWAKERS